MYILINFQDKVSFIWSIVRQPILNRIAKKNSFFTNDKCPSVLVFDNKLLSMI